MVSGSIEKQPFNSGFSSRMKRLARPFPRQGKEIVLAPFPLGLNSLIDPTIGTLRLEAMKLTGLIAATYTPFREDGTVNLDLIPAMIDYMIESGVSGFHACGSAVKASP